MRYVAIAAIVLISLQMSRACAQSTAPDGTWLVSQRIAFDIYQCQNALCGRIAWLRNPALRTAEMCGRLLVWGLTADGPMDGPADGSSIQRTAPPTTYRRAC